MNFINTIKEMQNLSTTWQLEGQHIGFVPTMGNLHAGHLSLVKKASEVCDKVVVSIFVNPLQFDDGQDFARYPRTIEEDQEELSAHKVDAVFVPDEQELYPLGKETTTKVEVPGISNILEGASRAGHFVGVTTVVNKLFNIVQPHIAVFGEKDFQQLHIIRQMVSDLNIPVEIIGMPTAREVDGLAMSSRNNRLDSARREIAPVLHQVLDEMREKILQGRADVPVLKQSALEQLSKAGFEPDYIELRDATNLQEPTDNTTERVILAAARLGEIRLIDNLRV
ncbi:MAG: pantoate--beta-alanine ligase [Gammaproteobacteria bacterium]